MTLATDGSSADTWPIPTPAFSQKVSHPCTSPRFVSPRLAFHPPIPHAFSLTHPSLSVYTTPAPKGPLGAQANALRRTSGSMPAAVQAHDASSSPSFDSAQHLRPLSGTSSFSRPSTQTTLRSSLPTSTDSKTLSMASQQSAVMHETLTVIDEHMNDLNPAAMHQPPGNRRDTMSSVYTSPMAGNRRSYIAGHETDEEEHQLHTEAEVLSWSPDHVAEYLEDHGVEPSHCHVFREQEITGEVLLAMDQSSVFLKEFDLGAVGRRLRTWHKIKTLQDEVRRTSALLSPPRSDPSIPSVVHELDADAAPRNRSASATSAAAAAAPRALVAGRSNTMQSYSQPLPATANSANTARLSGGPVSPLQNMTSKSRSDHSPRPSAQIIRSMNHSRRHSSIDSTTANSIDGTTASRTLHKKQPSSDQQWPFGQPQPNGRPAGHGHTVSSEATPVRESPFDMPAVTSPSDTDKGYFSSTEAEPRSRNRYGLLQKKLTPGQHSPVESRTGSFFSYGRRNNPQSARVVSSDSTRDPVSPIASPNGHAGQFADTRTASMPTYQQKPINTVRESANPMVTKLDYGDSPSINAIASSSPSGPASEPSSVNATPNSSSAHLPFFFSKTSKPAGLRVSSDAVTKQEKSAAGTVGIPATVKEGEVASPARDGSSTPSTEAQSMELKSGSRTSAGSGSNLMPPSSGAPRRPKLKTKKSTSAYTRGLEKKTPAEQMVDCDYSGWMKKKSGSLMSTWKPRLFVLRGRRLSYYYSEADTEEKGLIDISFHNVVPAHNEKLTGLHASVMGGAGSPAGPADSAAAPTAAQQDLLDHPLGPGADDDALFIFKLTPPKAGRGVNFTKPTVHYFAVNSRQEGRLWMAALMKAVIERDRDGAVTTTYNQKTISLAKARARRERPPALQDGLHPASRAELAANGDEDDDDDDDDDGNNSAPSGLGISGMSANGTAAVAGAEGAKDNKAHPLQNGSALAPHFDPQTAATSTTTRRASSVATESFDIGADKSEIRGALAMMSMQT